jgi:Na+-driven multidrug efflux pump
MRIMSLVGIFATVLLIFGAEPLFKLFINEPEAIEVGVVYLQILGLSQLFMCIEITTAGAFNGLNRTLPPSFVGIFFTGLRVPGALILSSPLLLGLEGVWWSISMTSVLKGLVLLAWFMVLLMKSKLTPDWNQPAQELYSDC